MRGSTTSTYQGTATRGLIILCSVIICSLMATLLAAAPSAAAPASEETLQFTNARDLSMELTPEGLPIISYVDVASSELIHIVCDDPACEGTEDSVVVADATHADMAIDSSGRPVLVYSNDDGGWLARCSTVNCDGPGGLFDRGLISGGGIATGTLLGAISVTPLPNMPDVNHRVKVALDSNDHPAILGAHSTGAWYVNRCDDPLCDGDDVWSFTVYSFAGEFAFDPSNRPVVIQLGPTLDFTVARCNTDCSAVTTGSDFPAAASPYSLPTALTYTVAGLPAVLNGNRLTLCQDLDCTGISSIDALYSNSTAVALANRSDFLSMVFWNSSNNRLQVQHCLDELCNEYTIGEFSVGAGLGSVGKIVAHFDGDEILTVALATDTGVHVVRCADRRCRSGDLVGADDAFDATEDQSFTTGMSVLGNDGSLTSQLTAVLVDPPANGEVNLLNVGVFDYTPDPDFNGIDTFTYKAVDEFAGVESSPVTVSMDVAPVNDGPAAAPDDTASTTAGTPIVINVVDGSAGGEDIDVDGDTLSVTSTTAPDEGGMAVPSGETILYTPADGFVGKEVFNYTVSDGNGETDTALVTVTVTEAGSTPPPPPAPPAPGPGPASSAKCAGKTVTVDLSKGETPTAGDDVILGTSAAEVIDGLGGNDTICGKGGNDTIRGGAGKDVVVAGGGNDIVVGGGGKDRLVGGKGKDKLTGGKGNDTLVGGAGKDRLVGGAGKDKLNAGKGSDKLLGGAGNDVLNGGAGSDTCKGGPGADKTAKCEK